LRPPHLRTRRRRRGPPVGRPRRDHRPGHPGRPGRARYLLPDRPERFLYPPRGPARVHRPPVDHRRHGPQGSRGGQPVSSTRRASKRARLARRDENDQMRTARRDSLTVLLARLARGIAPTPDEAALLRAAVEAEIREGDAARTSERGQQRAMEQQRQRVDAAEAAIVEAEQRAEDAERQLADMTRDRDGWWAAADRATEEHGRDAEEHRRRLAAVLA